MENITVCIRTKPKLSDEESSNSQIWKIEDNQILNLKSKDIFAFDRIFPPEVQNIGIFNEAVKENLNKLLKGINVSIFAYGQTSTGKTYTMRGLDYSPGIIPLSLNYIFMKLTDGNDEDSMKIKEMKVAYLEIYNESINDLLDTSKKNLEIREGKKGIYVENLTEIRADTPEIAFNLVKQGDSNKIIAETKLNEKSSRSHCIFRLSLEVQDSKGKTYQSVLNLIDLAGSENATKTKTEGVRLKEGSNINKSLLALSNVIQKLSTFTGKTGSNNYISYRDSKLTRYLQPSLSGNSKTMIICTISKGNYSETLNTLLFASRAKNIKTNTKINEVVDEKEKIIIENNELKTKIKLLENKMQTSSKKPSKTYDYIVTSSKKTVLEETAKKNNNDLLFSNLEKDVNMIKSFMLSSKKEVDATKQAFNQPFSLINNTSTKAHLMESASKYENKENNDRQNLYKSCEKTRPANPLNKGQFSMIPNSFTNPNWSISKSVNVLGNNGIEHSSPYINRAGNFHNSSYCGYAPYGSDFSYGKQFNVHSSIEDYETELFELKKQNRELKQHFMEALDKKNQSITNLTETSEKIRRDLEENYLKIRLENERIKEELNGKETDLREIISKLNTSEKQIIILREEIKNIKSAPALSSIENELTSTSEKVNFLEKELANHKEIYEKTKVEVQKLREKNLTLVKCNETLNGENFSLKTQQEMTHKSMDSLKMENIQLRNNIDSYKAEIGLMQTKLIQRKSELMEVKTENEKILKKNFSLEYETKIKSLTNSKTNLEKELHAKDEVVKQLEYEREIMRNQLEILRKNSNRKCCENLMLNEEADEVGTDNGGSSEDAKEKESKVQLHQCLNRKRLHFTM